MSVLAEPVLPPRRMGGAPPLYDYPAYRRDPLAFWLETGGLAPVVRVRFGPVQRFWVVTDPELVEQLLLKQVKDFPRDRRLMRLNNPGSPELMFNTDRWEEWRWRRRLMQPAFHRRKIAEFGARMVGHADRAAVEMIADGTVDLESRIRTLTMRMILDTMFSVRAEEDVATLHAGFEASSDFTFRRAASPFPLPLALPLPSHRRVKREADARLSVLREIVARRAETGPQGDFLDMLIAARLEEEDRAFTPEQLVYEMSGIVFAGHETTAMTTMWLLYLLSTHPDAYERVIGEIDAVLGDRDPTVADLDRMPYVHWAIQETLRLYPPVYVTLREADAGGRFGDFDLPAGTRFIINIRGLHRDPGAWESPDAFRPERFDPATADERHRFQFIPFLAGPKKCLGDTFAMTEMRLVVPTLLRRLKVEPVGESPPVAEPGFTLSVRGGLPVRVTPRRRETAPG